MTPAALWRALSYLITIGGAGVLLAVFGLSDTHVGAFAIGGITGMAAITCALIADDVAGPCNDRLD